MGSDVPKKRGGDWCGSTALAEGRGAESPPFPNGDRERMDHCYESLQKLVSLSKSQSLGLGLQIV